MFQPTKIMREPISEIIESKHTSLKASQIPLQTIPPQLQLQIAY